MYEVLLFVHSWFRWCVVVGIVYFFVRSIIGWWKQAPWTEQDSYFIWAFNQIFGYQVMFGLTLWIGFSPITKIGFKNTSYIFSNSVINFWILRHPLTMIFALGVFHMGKGRVKKASIDDRFKIFAITFLILILMIGSAIPWPWLSYGRNFFRWFL